MWQNAAAARPRALSPGMSLKLGTLVLDHEAIFLRNGRSLSYEGRQAQYSGRVRGVCICRLTQIRSINPRTKKMNAASTGDFVTQRGQSSSRVSLWKCIGILQIATQQQHIKSNKDAKVHICIDDS